MGSGDPAQHGGGGGSPSDLDVGDEDNLQGLKKRVDRLLGKLDKSAASHKHIADQKVSKEAFGSFGEAQALSDAYDRVHQRLELLSQMLGDQLEAMSLAVGMADRDYKNVDREHSRRLAAIQKRSIENWEQQQKLKQQAQAGKQNTSGDHSGQGGGEESSDQATP
ncbi:hypothetical protein J7W19_23945 [Streptomyces mobaraensis NBRC 13819 = DSM 40847]|uniref:Uncharacterized protein n=1 Tax=Streptomyces mobaraensis (strain ATCC 29032 / DSM 40847 / JCM 4168 / NBRC 13819 / NCIMB 11159 / IPCR 16-22) TaxID=1223523 RepID=M3A1T6_STRM1|nr:hypothetical protein [Streptomyces mobaraensis]EME99038.1 hypothetical protein H340_18421 [Streptomyces mobaraensis NBRC 13819 = DSM 40847]QTT76024.1 hypothetical protein J7W19_23945 [Streptomyces mobaraensis NBRC 13819 = DSM 40847]